MAIIFRRTGRDGKPAEKWSYKFKDENNKWVTKTGHRLKEKTREDAEAAEERVRKILRGEIQPEPEPEPQVMLDDLLEQFRKSREAVQKTPRYIDQTVNRIRRVFDECGFVTADDLSSEDAAHKFNDFLVSLTWKGNGKEVRPCSQRTRNHYIVVIKTFCHWAKRKLRDCPLLDAERLAVVDARKRRAATLSEVAKILTAAENGPDVFGLTGKERATLYRVALNTGFRVSELASLTPASFTFGKSPYVLLEAGNAKNRKEVEQPIPQLLVKPLKAFLKGLPTDAAIWPGNWVGKAARMLRTDLAAAEVDGLDFHSLRTTFITNLARSGVHPKTAQELARHSDINLTMGYYTKLRRDELAAVLPCI